MSNENKNQVQKIERDTGTEVSTQDQVSQVFRLIELAIHQGADVDKLERLMDMQERWENKEAEKAFNKAFNKFKAIVPRITKKKQGHNYKYAPLGDIDEQIKSSLQECGLSYNFRFAQSQFEVTTTCVVKHELGHSEETTLSITVDEPNKMQNKAQMIAIATAYGQRYSLIGGLGLSTADEDIDGRLPQDNEQHDQQPANQYYPDSEFNKQFPAWEKQILSGNKTAERIITYLSNKGVNLSAEQTKQIKNVGA